MSKAKLAAARELIEEKKYVEAQTLLLTIKDDPTAAKWLAQLETRIARTPQSAPLATRPPTKNYTVLPAQNERWVDPEEIMQRQPPPEPVENVGMAGIFRIIWGILTLLSIGWICYGLTVSFTATGNQLSSTAARNSQGYQAGTLIGGGLGITFFLCTGAPFLLIFGLLYWRNGVAIRETKKHNQMVAAMQGRRS